MFMHESDRERLDPELLDRLDRLGYSLPDGVTVLVNSGYRRGDLGAHGLRKAADLKVVGGWQRKILTQHALKIFMRVGVYPRHVHVDVDRGRPWNVLWAGCYHGNRNRRKEDA